MRALITGGHGFAGRHLAQHLVDCKEDVAVTYHPNEDAAIASRAAAFPLPKTVQSFALDVTDRQALSDIVGLTQPDVIYHLAGITFVPDAERAFEQTFAVNHRGVVNLLDAVREKSPETRVLLVTSAEVYGEPVPGSLPLTEQAVLRPVTTYGLSKCAADLTGCKYALGDGLHVVRVRPFPHIGPGQSDSFALSSFAKQVASIKLGKSEPIIRVGNLEARRDYSDVSDIVRGYREAALNGNRGGVYNLSSGQSYEIGELLQKIIAIAEVDVEVQVDPERVRPVEIADMYGSYALATKQFGWKPRVDIEGTLHSLFAYWLETLSE